MTKYKITIHPLYFLLCLYYIVIGKTLMFFSCFLCVVLHELAHASAGKIYGYQMSKITLMPYGAMIYGGEQFNRKEGLVIALAGPFCNILLAIFVLALWWIVPESFVFTKDFLYANISLAMFNLLPCFPLDGSRVVLSFFANKLRTLKILKILGCLISIVFVILGVLSFWYKPNITLINVGVFLFLGAIFASKKEEYCCIAGRMSFVKNYKKGVVARDIYVSSCVKLFELIKFVKNDYLTTFIVVDENQKELLVFDEDKLKEMLEKFDHKLTLKQIVFSNCAINRIN